MDASSQPVLKWPGGKAWVAKRLAAAFRSLIIEGSCYFEPFLGGGSVFFSLMPSVSVLSDVNPALIEFFNILRDRPDELVKAVWRFSNEKDTYYRVRGSKPRTAVGRAARFLYLNRTCWGGVYRENGQGEFNVPFGNSGRCICRKSLILEAAEALQGADLRCHDFEESLSIVKNGDVVYLDPPYSIGFGKDCFRRYNAVKFEWSDHMRLVSSCKNAARQGAFVCVSAAMHQDLLATFKGWWLVRCERPSSVSRTREGRYRVEEALICSTKPPEPFKIQGRL